MCRGDTQVAGRLSKGNVMEKIVTGLMLGLLIGAGCRWFEIPSPSPPSLIGALPLVVMTVCYTFTDAFLAKRAPTTKHLCSGPTGSIEHRSVAGGQDS
jgi:XapX domain-containing protein